MSETLHFLPWIRRGVALTIDHQDDGRSNLPRSAPLDAWVDINGERANAAIALRPADHVTGIEPTMILRRYPAPAAAEAEYGYFPIVELGAADLPWVVTPAAPGNHGRLRPWVALVCLPEAEAELVTGAGGTTRLLTTGSELPDPTETWAWAHVQSAVEAAEVADALDHNPLAVVARLVCPRRLLPGTVYRAALVNAFTPTEDGTELAPAWSADGPADLVVYDTWTFTTGQASSFEEMCDRLGPVTDPDLQLGLTPMDVHDLGPIGDWPPTIVDTTVDYAGAIQDTGLEPDGLGPRATQFFEHEVTDLLDRGEVRQALDPDDPDPVVTPPFVGAYAADNHQVPADHWQRDVNLDPTHRAAAGLGAEVVRRNQERFMALAWQQAGQLRETNRQLSSARLQSEIGRVVKARVDRLDAHHRVAVTWPQLSFLRDDQGEPPRQILTESTIPNALASPAYVRMMRPGGVVARAAQRRAPEAVSVQSAIGATFGNPVERSRVSLGTPGIPAGTTPANPVRNDYLGLGRFGKGRRRRRRRARSDERLTERAILGSSETLALDEVAAVATDGIAPLASARARTEQRIPALARVFAELDIAEDELPSRIRIGPTIDEALVWSLLELSAELVMPGADAFPDNAVRVAETNSAFVASFLAGANTEMTEELVWREFPAQLGSTTFRRFWDRPDRSSTDIDPMEQWDDGELDQLAGADTDTLVVLVRGDLIRHYPTVRILLRDGKEGGVEVMPSFGGMIPPDIRFLAFDFPAGEADAVTAAGSSWEVVFEEQVTEPRFGLDTVAEGDPVPPLVDWNDLSWDHVADQEGPGSHLVLAPGLERPNRSPDGAVWGRNGAHMARATYQAPYRHSIPVTLLLGGGAD